MTYGKISCREGPVLYILRDINYMQSPLFLGTFIRKLEKYKNIYYYMYVPNNYRILIALPVRIQFLGHLSSVFLFELCRRAAFQESPAEWEPLAFFKDRFWLLYVFLFAHINLVIFAVQESTPQLSDKRTLCVLCEAASGEPWSPREPSAGGAGCWLQGRRPTLA